MFRSNLFLAALCAASPAFAAIATSVTLNHTTADDTYLDSYNDNSGLLGGDNENTNYGNLGAIKAVAASQGSVDFPAPSFVHGLFKLPGQIFNDSLGASANITSATLTFRVRSNGGLSAAQFVELLPLLQQYNGGNGGLSSQTKGGGALNTGATKYGADWDDAKFNADGSAVPWSLNGVAVPGAPYDSAEPIPTSTTFTTGSGASAATYVTFDLTSLLRNQTAYNEVMTNGILMRMSNETTEGANDYESFYSADTTSAPVLAYTAIPEPATLGMLGGLTLLAVRRRRRV